MTQGAWPVGSLQMPDFKGVLENAAACSPTEREDVALSGSLDPSKRSHSGFCSVLS